MKIIQEGRIPRLLLRMIKPEKVGMELACRVCGARLELEADDVVRPRYNLRGYETGHLVVCSVCINHNDV